MNITDITPPADAPKIEFPCEAYLIKVIGDASEGFTDMVVEIIRTHAPDIDASKVTRRDSSNGRFHAVQVYITATGIPQLEAINADLRATGQVRMVL